MSVFNLKGLTAQQLRELSREAIDEAGRVACTAGLMTAGYCAGDAGHQMPHWLISECTFHGTSNQGGLVRVEWNDAPLDIPEPSTQDARRR